MSFEELWLTLAKKKPLLNDPGCSITIGGQGFKELLRHFYKQGEETGKTKSSLFDSLFGSLGQ